LSIIPVVFKDLAVEKGQMINSINIVEIFAIWRILSLELK